MRVCPAVIVCLVLGLGLCACVGTVGQPPAAGYPFGALPPPAAPLASHGWPWVFLAGLGLGLGVAALWRRRVLRQALREPEGRLLPGEVGRLRLMLGILEDLILNAGRRGKVVRLADWLRRKGGGPGGRL